MSRLISPSEAKAAIHGAGESAFLDLREAGPFSMGHPLFAIPCPYSTLELRIGHLVPRHDVPVILIDDGDGIAARAAQRIEAMGYTDVAVIEGGAPAWSAAGYGLFKGVNVPCKLLGELVGEMRAPKRIGPDELARWQDEGRDFAFYDCRPPAEFEKMTVPGAACLPNGEVAHRLPVAVAKGQPLLLTCAGRTRSLIGTVSVAEVAPDLEVYALENGTQGWALSGRALALDNHAAPLPELDDDGRAETEARAAEFMSRKGLDAIDATQVNSFLADDTRTTFLLDVRSEHEALDDPLAAFEHALAVQIVQASDQWIGVRRARVVLADDLGLRAAVAAYWLGMLGFEAYVLRIDDAVRAIKPRQMPHAPTAQVPEIEPSEALECIARGDSMRLIDVRPSSQYRKASVEGAIWGTRPAISDAIDPGAARYVVIGDGTGRGALAAGDLRDAGASDVARIRGGYSAMAAAGAKTAPGHDLPSEMETADVTWFAHGRHDGDPDASRLYLAWEVGLEHQLDAAERAEYPPDPT